MALLVSTGLTPMLIRWADKKNLVDVPDVRKIHRKPIARLGGIAIFVGTMLAIIPLLCLDNNMCDIMIEYVKRGFPQSLDTMPNAGVTAPIHPAGTLTMGMAETLGGLVLAYSINPDACISLDTTPSFSDMSTGVYKYAGAERLALLGARVQMLHEYYGCPSGVHGGKTDSLLSDARSGTEKSLSLLLPVLCGAIGVGTVGQIENGLTFSPVQLVMDNEITRYVRRAVQGFEVTDSAINVDLIKKVGIGGNFLEEPDTAQGFRQILMLSPFFRADSWGSDPRCDENKEWIHMAEEKAREYAASDGEPPLTGEQEREIDNIVREAEAKLKESGEL